MLGDGTSKTVKDTKEFPPIVGLSDSFLTSTPTAVDDRRNGLSQWQVDNMKRRNRPLINTVLDSMKRDQLTPLQAEMIGVLSQRYIPLLKKSLDSLEELKANDQGEKEGSNTRPKADAKPFTLNLADGKVASPESEYFADLIRDARSETAHLGDVGVSNSDTELRFFLAANGTDLARPVDAVVPHIDWRPIERSISIQGGATGEQYMLPTDLPRKLKFDLVTFGIDGVDLSIRPLTDNAKFLKCVEFGFNRKFETSKKIRDMKPGDRLYERIGEVEVFFRCRNPDKELIGPNYSFEILAKQWSTESDVELEPESLVVTVTLASNAKPLLQIRRIVGNPDNTDSVVPLWPFDPGFQGNGWEPAELKTLANLKSGFEFSLRNNIESDRSFEIQLFRIRKIPPGMDRDLFRSDRVTNQAARDYIQALAKRAANLGQDVFDSNNEFERLATASLNATPGKDESISFQAPPQPAKPKVENSEEEAEAPAPKQDGPKIETAEYPLLLVFTTNDPSRDPEEPVSPDLFQLLTYKIDYPANPSPNLSLFLDNLLGDRKDNLPELLASTVDLKETARMTRVTEKSFLENFHSVENVGIKQLMAADSNVFNHVKRKCVADARHPGCAELPGLQRCRQ